MKTADLTAAWADLTPFHVRRIVTYIEQRAEECMFDLAAYAERRLYVRVLEAIAKGGLRGGNAMRAAEDALKTQDLPIHDSQEIFDV